MEIKQTKEELYLQQGGILLGGTIPGSPEHATMIENEKRDAWVKRWKQAIAKRDKAKPLDITEEVRLCSMGTPKSYLSKNFNFWKRIYSWGFKIPFIRNYLGRKLVKLYQPPKNF